MGEPSSYYVTVSLVTAKTWAPKAGDFSLELAGVDDWVEGVAYKGADADGTIPLTLGGVESEITLRFPRPVEASAEPVYLHLASPRVRFELPK